ncbi:unnamed protein product [Hermetia illucens]|uniref:Chitin-binding type-2 domain-containing protein n=1 Tax=Hermetia illucens TaxID=343691 RepID=A0A7R8V1F3_HERIL|nr:unnamed protein product [Hermetia illucens]
MRAVLCIFLVVLTVATAARFRSDGRPGCKTPEEMMRPWRHHLDPTKFWLCTHEGVSALPVKCSEGTAFSEEALVCVPWEEWIWTDTKLPPSLADD